jgi:hypothetical protein
MYCYNLTYQNKYLKHLQDTKKAKLKKFGKKEFLKNIIIYLLFVKKDSFLLNFSTIKIFV